MGDSPTIQRGTCLALFAYDVGRSIDLDQAERMLLSPAATQRETIRRTRRAPSYFEFKPSPLRVTVPARPIEVCGRQTASTVDMVLYDFGAVSLAYSIPIDGLLDALLPLSGSLYDNRALLDDARARVGSMIRDLGPALHFPHLAAFVEDYFIFQITEHSAGDALHSWLSANRPLLARVLRAESASLSTQEIEDAVSTHISYGDLDLAFIDWNATILFDPDPQDASAALEFANVELLEMRHLDDRLDAALDEIYRAIDRGQTRRSPAGTMRRLSTLQIDSAMLFEGVNNALKLLGDQYLARVYRLAAQRFHLPEHDATILRKLATLDGIYQKLSDRQATRRAEILEWIIIGLIAFEIVFSFWRR